MRRNFIILAFSGTVVGFYIIWSFSRIKPTSEEDKMMNHNYNYSYNHNTSSNHSSSSITSQIFPSVAKNLETRKIKLDEKCAKKFLVTDKLYCSKDPTKRSLSDKTLQHNMYGNVQIDCHDETFKFPRHSLEQMFYSDEFKFIACVPTKCGTTTWQQSMASLRTKKIEDDDDGTLKPIVERKPKDFKGMEIFRSVDRLSHIPYNLAVSKLKDPNYSKIIHIRNPYSRLYSAWRQKFKKGHSTIDFFQKKYADKVNIMFGKEETETHIITFNNFVKYIAEVKQDRRFDVHWNTFQYYCAPCQIEYQYITMTETQSQDMAYLFSNHTMMSDNHNKTAFDYIGKYLPQQYNDSPMKDNSVKELYRKEGVSEEVINKIADIYYWDFELFGYERTF